MFDSGMQSDLYELKYPATILWQLFGNIKAYKNRKDFSDSSGCIHASAGHIYAWHRH